MPHLPVVLRRAAKLSVVLILLGVAEYVIIANIHTNLGDHHTRREAAKIAQSLSQGFYDWDQDRDFRVVGYSWQAREAERQKKPNGKQDSVSRIGRAAKDLPLSVPSDATTPKRERQTTDHRNAPKHRDKSFISNDARQESVLDTQDKAMRPGQSDRIRPQAKRQHQSTVNPFTDTGTVQTPSRDFSVSTDFIAKRDPALSQNRGGIWKKVLPPSSSKREHKETFREGITDVRGDKKAHQIFNEVPKESESEAEYLNRLLLSYMMESKHRNRAEIPQSDSNRETELVVDYDNLQIIQTDRGLKVVDKRLALGPEVLVENSSRPYRNLSQSEMKGSDIMFTLRTTTSYHRNRLPLLMETWMSQVDCSHIFLVTDGADPEMERKSKAMGMHYEVAKCGKSHFRDELCCKAGEELELLFKPENKRHNWLCHIDDDMYINLKPLVRLLSKFDPRTEPVYLGRSGSDWREPRKVKDGALLGKVGRKYHFAVGGMYCLSRALLAEARPHLVGGRNFASSCSKTLEPEDVTVGFIVGIVLNHTLSRTELINTHGIHLASYVDPYTLGDQVAISYGFGSEKWGYDDYNAVYVPDAMFEINEDESQFRSLHCHLYPETKWCAERKLELDRLYQERNKEYNYYAPHDLRL